MKKRLQMASVLLLFMSCQNNSEKKGNMDSTQQMLLYVRLEGENNGCVTSNDYLAITNYINKPKTAAELYKIATQYLDTAKATFEVNAVTFLAKDLSYPASDWNSVIAAKNKKYYLIGFEFNHFTQSYKKDPKKLFAIMSWKDGQVREYDIREEKRFIDSILKSPVPLTIGSTE
jgi:hypothetical protein